MHTEVRLDKRRGPLTKALLFATVLAAGCTRSENTEAALPLVYGSWQWTYSFGGWNDDTLRARTETILLLTLRDDFRLVEGADLLGEGKYSLYWNEEPGYGTVPEIHFSTDVPMFGPDADFIVRLSGDTLTLESPWTDTYHHRWIRREIERQ